MIQIPPPPSLGDVAKENSDCESTAQTNMGGAKQDEIEGNGSAAKAGAIDEESVMDDLD